MTRRTVLKIGFGALTPAAKCAKFNLFGALPERAALSRRETHKRPDVALLAPGGKARGVEALAASHRCDLACSRQGVGLTHDTQLVLGTEAPAARALAPTRRAELLHAIDWHHGPPPGKPPGGAGAEALALWRANQLETTVKSRMEGPGPVEP